MIKMKTGYFVTSLMPTNVLAAYQMQPHKVNYYTVSHSVVINFIHDRMYNRQHEII